ncbi:FtsX-like permease family protein [Fusobacterium massiliense]|uniref:ABC transporter permease n=1 Tax=Fusobacterium massiliense TaxID=1852365 RepID=UPI0028ED19DD|nr:FtsX-like permease family protein [Fusobacterium massiliense]
MFWRMVRGTLFRQRSKMLMIAFTVALGVSLATAMMNVMLGVGDKVNKELKTYGANITVMHKDASILDDLYGISGETVSNKFLIESEIPKIKQIFWGFAILDFAPYLERTGEIEGISNKIKIYGTWFDKHMVMPTGEEVDAGIKNLKTWWEVKGEWLSEDDLDKVMLGSLIAGKYNINIGDKIKVKGSKGEKELIVKGIINSGGDDDQTIYMNLKNVQDLYGLEDKVSMLEVSALTTPDNDLAKKAAQDPNSLTISEYETWYCTAYVSTISYQIQEVLSDSVAKPNRQVAESEGTILNKTELLMLLICILSSFASALGISNLITASVIERSQEIGLVKAIGGTSRRIIILILTEVVLTGILGGIFGYIAGIGFTQIIGKTVFSSYISPAVIVIPIDIALVFAVTILGSIPAIKYLLTLKPTEVLHGR